MTLLAWLAANWFVSLQSAGIVGGLIYTGLSFRKQALALRVNNLLTITQQHRDIWTQLYKREELSRVLSRQPDLEREPIVAEEELFVTLLILHLNSAFYAARAGMFVTPEHLQEDIRHFFSLPIPTIVWRKVWHIQNTEFALFVSRVLKP
jgi:hypothetical protein